MLLPGWVSVKRWVMCGGAARQARKSARYLQANRLKTMDRGVSEGSLSRLDAAVRRGDNCEFDRTATVRTIIMSQTKQTDGSAKDTMPAADFVTTLADEQGVVAHAHNAFGEPVRQGGVTIVPVARVGWGFGGGLGKGAHDSGGGGGGGGVRIFPLGYIEIKDDRSEYKPIRDPVSLVPLVVAGGVVGLLLLRGLKRLLAG